MKNIKDIRIKRNHKDITFRDTVNFDGTVLSINNNVELGSYRSILRAIHSQCKIMLSHYTKVYALRLDLHVNSLVWEDNHLSKLLKNIKHHIKSYYQCAHVSYVWAREVTQGDGHHYHLVIMVDGHKVNRPKKIFDFFNSYWNNLGHESIHIGRGHVLTSSVDQTFKDAYRHFSYLAKIHTKDQQPPNKQNFNASRLKPHPTRMAA